MRLPALTLLTGLALALACDAKDDDLTGGDDAAMPDEGDTDAEDAGEDPDAGDTEPGTDDPGADEPGTDDPGTDDPGTDDPGTDDPPAPVACDAEESFQACALDGGGEGTQFCAPVGEAGALQWGTCLESVECMPGEYMSCGPDPGCEPSEGVECPDFGTTCTLHGDAPGFEEDACNTPLVLSFDGAPVQMGATPAATFDIDTVGACTTTDWPAAVTPWLALDLDHSGSIEAGHELFGSGTRLASGGRAKNGFLALADLDDNGDGKITASDARFGDLVLWADHDADKAATLAELEPLGMRGILSIELDYAIDRRCDDRGNCEVERASFTFIDRGGAVRKGDVVDIHLACQ